MSEWVSVADRLPPERGRYIVYATIYFTNHEGKQGSFKMVCISQYSEWEGFDVAKKVTHWMPLPEPPKEVE